MKGWIFLRTNVTRACDSVDATAANWEGMSEVHEQGAYPPCNIGLRLNWMENKDPVRFRGGPFAGRIVFFVSVEFGCRLQFSFAAMHVIPPCKDRRHLLKHGILTADPGFRAFSV